MQTSYKKEEDCTESVTCTYTVAEVNDAFEKAIRIFSSSLQMDGFRKGKVPSSIVEQRVGEELLFKVAEILSRAVYKEVDEKKGVLLSSGLSPKGETDDDIVLPKKNEEYTATYTFSCIPEVTLPEYSSIKEKLEVEPVTEEELEKAIFQLLIKQAELLEESKNEQPQSNDIAIISLTIKDKDSRNLIGQQAEYSYVLPCENFLQPLEESIRGMKKGEEKNITYSFPVSTSLNDSSIVSGKNCDITIQLKDIRTIIKLAESPDLLKKMGYESYEDFKAMYKEILTEYKTASAKTELQRDIINNLAKHVECDIPSTLIELFMEAVLDNFESLINAQGFSINLFASEYKYISEIAEKLARDMAKNQILLLNIAKKENIGVTDAEFAGFVQQLAQQADMDPMKLYEEYKEADMLLVLYQRLLADKTSLFIYKNAVETEEKKEEVEKEKKTTARSTKKTEKESK